MNIRLRYEKLGLMQFLSHLESMKTWEQLFRRERIPMLYTQGFNPKPQMNFALPLAVGIQAFNDYMEIAVEDDFELERFLQLDMPPGLKITGYKPAEGPSLMSLVASADFVIRGDLEPLRPGFELETLPFSKWTKKGMRTRDAKPLIMDHTFRDQELWVQLQAGSVANLKPTDLLESLLGESQTIPEYEITRVDVYDEQGHSLWLR